jgi:hypothetical protein
VPVASLFVRKHVVSSQQAQHSIQRVGVHSGLRGEFSRRDRTIRQGVGYAEFSDDVQTTRNRV